MIVLTERARVQHKGSAVPTFGAVLRGELIAIDPAIDGHIPLRCRGEKQATGEQYEFRILLTAEELRRIKARRK